MRPDAVRPSLRTVNAVTDLSGQSLENEAQAQRYLDCYGENASRNPSCAMAYTLLWVSLLVLVVAWPLPPSGLWVHRAWDEFTALIGAFAAAIKPLRPVALGPNRIGPLGLDGRRPVHRPPPTPTPADVSPVP